MIRRQPRLQCLRPAVITCDGTSISCVIRDISLRGACIGIVNEYPRSNAFWLEDKFTAQRWYAAVVWRDHSLLGVQLFGKPPVFLLKQMGFGLRC